MVFFMKIFHIFLKRGEDILNSDAAERRFGSADIYDGSAISITSDRIPGSRGITDKITIGEKVNV